MHIAVPTPNVSIIVYNMMIIGQPLILQCIVTTVRGINSQVDIVWRNLNSGEEFRRNFTESITIFNSVVYRDYLNISQVTTDDNDVTYQCEVTINAEHSSVIETDTFTLHVHGKTPEVILFLTISVCSLQFQILLSIPHQLIFRKELQLVIIKISSVQ